MEIQQHEGVVVDVAGLGRGFAELLPLSEALGGQGREQGGSNSPIPIRQFSPLRLSLSQERGRSPSPDLRLRLLSLDSDRWDRSPPLPLAMDQGFSPNPSLSCWFSCL